MNITAKSVMDIIHVIDRTIDKVEVSCYLDDSGSTFLHLRALTLRPAHLLGILSAYALFKYDRQVYATDCGVKISISCDEFDELKDVA